MKVFTNGCFDIIHPQHIKLLQYCRVLAQTRFNDGKVIVGINSDKSIERLKGAGRPMFDEHARSIILLALECVDEVHIFPEQTPYKLIYDLQPDAIVKGKDWEGKTVIGSTLLPKGRVYFAPTDDSITTTKIIEKIKNLM